MTDIKTISKTMSYWLRHKPAAGRLALDDAGWTSVDRLIDALGRKGLPCNRATLDRVVAENDKKRFEYSEDGARIRARQGHSVAVDLDWPVLPPPAHLFHGTVDRFLDAIMAEGLKPMKRHHVHLSPDVETATLVGGRRGKPVILRIGAGAMAEAGHMFRRTANNVWLVGHVPPEWIERL